MDTTQLQSFTPEKLAEYIGAHKLSEEIDAIYDAHVTAKNEIDGNRDLSQEGKNKRLATLEAETEAKVNRAIKAVDDKLLSIIPAAEKLAAPAPRSPENEQAYQLQRQNAINSITILMQAGINIDKLASQFEQYLFEHGPGHGSTQAYAELLPQLAAAAYEKASVGTAMARGETRETVNRINAMAENVLSAVKTDTQRKGEEYCNTLEVQVKAMKMAKVRYAQRKRFPTVAYNTGAYRAFA